MSSCCSVTTRKIIVFGLGILIAYIAITIGVLWPALSIKLLYSELTLKPGSLNYNNWIETPIPIYLEISLFNWTNPDDINNHTIKPTFTEMGPYVFSEKHKRVDLKWNDNGTVSFNQTRIWNFIPDKSNGTLDDLVTAPNVISATVAYMVRNELNVIKLFANYMLNHKGGSMAKTKTVREWLFDGYDDELLDFLKSSNSPKITIPFDKFGWFAGRNDSSSYDGRFTMYTGQNYIYDLGILTHWNGLNQTRYYKNECGKVNGTSGELWPPKLDSNTEKTVFATDICRFVSLDVNKTIIKHGINGTKWIGTDRVFDNGQKYHETRCFCVEKDDKNCPKSGVLDISECRYGAPVFVSYPHFYLADQEYINNVIGMKPNREKHEFSMSLETFAGIPLEVNARLQINMLMQPFEKIDLYKNVPKVMMPMFWFRQYAELDADLANQVKLALNLNAYGVYAAIGIGILGLIIIVIGIILTVTKSWSRKRHDDQAPLTN